MITKNKLLTVMVAIIAFSSMSAAFNSIDDVYFDEDLPSEHEAGTNLEIKGTAEGWNLDEVVVYETSGFNQRVGSDQCAEDGQETCEVSVEESFEEGSKEFKITAYAGGLTDDSDLQTVEFAEGTERETSITFSGVPDTAELGEYYDVEAEAFDSRGNLWNRDFKLFYEYYDSGYQSERIGLNDCYWNPGLGTDRERCTVEGEFEPVQGASQNAIYAEIETSDGKTISDYRSFNIEEADDPANFDVEIDSFESVEEGETFEVDVTVSNTGDESGSQYIELEARGERQDREQIDLSEGDSESLTLEWDTNVGDSGYRTFYTSSEDDTESDTVRIREGDTDDPANFDVEIDSFESVEEGETLEVDYTVTNVGDSFDSQFVELEARSERRDRDFRSLSSGESESGTLRWDTQVGDNGYRTFYVSSDDDSESDTVLIREREDPDDPAFFDVRIDNFSSVTEGEAFEVDYTVTNTGGRSDSQNIELRARGERQDRDFNVDLSEEESKSGTLRWNTEIGDSGYRSFFVSSDDDEETDTVLIRSEEDRVEDPDLSLTSVTASNYNVGDSQSTTLKSNTVNEGGQSTSFSIRWNAEGIEIGRSFSTVDGGSDRDLNLQRSFSQLKSRGLSPGNCYTLEGQLYSNSELIETIEAPQPFCLEDRDDDTDPELYDLDAFVISDRGSPLEDAQVSVADQTVSTDSSGRASIQDIEEGVYDVTASKSGYRTKVRNNVNINRDRSISMTLEEIDGPEADFTWSPDRPEPGEDIVFDGSRSSGDIVSYSWDFDNGDTATDSSPVHSFDSSGFYAVNLEVEDENGRTDERTRVVQVRSADEDPEFYDLNVQVVNSQTDDPIRDARVSASGSTRTTDSNGRTSFNLEESVYSLFISADNYHSKTRTVTMDRNRDITVELDPRDVDTDPRPERGVRINDIRMPSSVCRGEDVQARVDLENTQTNDRAFTLSASGLSNEIDRSYVLEGEESFTRTVDFVSVQGSGNERVSFTTGDDSRERTVQVRDCPGEEDAEISVSARPTQVRIGDSVRVSGYVDNVRRGTQVDISTSNRFRSLGSATTRPDGYYQVYVNPTQIGEQTITAEAAGREASTRIEVLPTVSVVSASSSPDRVFEGETYEVCGEVESQSAGPLVVLNQDGETVDSKYGRGEVCFERRSSPGSYDYEVEAWARGQSSSQRTSVEVLEMDSEVRNFPDQITSVRSGSGMIQVDLYNNQREFRDYQLELEGIPRDWVSQSRKEVMLDSGERSTQYFYITPKEEGTFYPTLTVRSDGEQIYSEEIRIRSGGTDREPSRWDRFKMWLRYR